MLTADPNTSLDHYHQQLADAHKPAYRFSGQTAAEFAAWKASLLPKLIASLGPMPQKVPLNPRVIEEKTEDGLVKQRVQIDLESGLSTNLLLFRPADAKDKLPAILCNHGHGPHGKDMVMGLTAATFAETKPDPDRVAAIAKYNYAYGLAMAKAGFVTCAIDWRGFGERDDRRDPAFAKLIGQRDICNILYLRDTMLGRTPLGLDIHDGRCALDFLCAQDFVDANRIGAMGLSSGGCMTVWLTLLDDRIKAADVACYSCRFAEFCYHRMSFCGSQITPGLFNLCDVPDLHGLIAPRPLLVEIGKQDKTFPLDPAMSCYHDAEKIYLVANAHEDLVLDLFDGGHQWNGAVSERFFRKYLGG